MPIFTVTGQVSPFLHVQMNQGEKIYAESDAMVSMDSTLDLQGQMKGGFFSALTRRLANGESFFQQHIEASRGSAEIFYWLQVCPVVSKYSMWVQINIC